MPRFRFITARVSLALALLIASAIHSLAATEQVIHAFRPYSNGGIPQAGLISDSQGNFYGTGTVGGTSGSGVVFELSPQSDGTWKETVLYNFAGGADGAKPISGLILDATGDLYGTTYSGGFVTGECGITGCGIVYELSANADGTWSKRNLYNFQGGFDGAFPEGTLAIDTSGNLYGTTTAGGGAICGWYYCGTVFELSPKSGGGWNKRTIYAFTSPNGANGNHPTAGLVLDSAGNLFGTTAWGGIYAESCSSGCGTVFELQPTATGSWTENTLYEFTGNSDGAIPQCDLILDSKGNLYGSTLQGGGVWELVHSQSGAWSYTLLQAFDTLSAAAPQGKLTFDSAGNIYGTSGGGIKGQGQVFELTHSASGWSFSSLYSFLGNEPNSNVLDGSGPESGVIFDHAGNLYGTTVAGAGANCSPVGGCGTVFKLSPSIAGQWTESIIDAFTGTDGALADVALIEDGAGNFYGVTPWGGVFGWGAVFKLTQSKGQWIIDYLHSFNGRGDGADPFGLAINAQGELFGVASSGGSSVFANSGCGVVFKLKEGTDGVWRETVLHRFGYPKDGCTPLGAPVFDKAGNLYGTTASGGDHKCPLNQDNGCGTVYELTPSASGEWTETLLHLFPSQPGDGQQPGPGLVFDAQGNIYGTAQYGGPNVCYIGVNCGTVFELSPDSNGNWNESVIYNFAATKDVGYAPNGLAIDGSGNLYGTTLVGGYNEMGCGTVFELSPSDSSWNTQVLYTFTAGTDGCSPAAPVVLDATGNLYGTTYIGLGSSSCGSAFELSPIAGEWSFSLLHDFSGGSDGCAPVSNLLITSQGKLLGTTPYGGSNVSYVGENPRVGLGTIFEITP